MRWALLIMVLTSALAFVVVGTGAVVAAHSIARRNALAEAERSAQSLSDTIFLPAMANALNGDPPTVDRLNRVVQSRSKDGSVVRVKVWRRDGTILYSNDSALVGKKFSVGADVRDVIDHQRTRSSLSNLDDPENAPETNLYDRLVEVYTPMTLPDGTKLAFETYSTDDRVVAAEHDLTRALVPFALGALVVLLIAQLPVSMWLVRRVGRAHQERSRLLNSTLIASARERRAIARELHDGVVQDLAGVGYAVGALAHSPRTSNDPFTRTTLDKVSAAVQDAVARLRTLMIDIYPPDLSADGLGRAVEVLAEPLRANDVEVDIAVDLPVEPGPEVAATLYRCAREGFANIVNHSGAQHVTLTLDGDAETVGLQLRDDGVGLANSSLDRRRDGHFGLHLLRDAAVDLGGEMSVTSANGSGTTLTMRLPTAGINRA